MRGHRILLSSLAFLSHAMSVERAHVPSKSPCCCKSSIRPHARWQMMPKPSIRKPAIAAVCWKDEQIPGYRQSMILEINERLRGGVGRDHHGALVQWSSGPGRRYSKTKRPSKLTYGHGAVSAVHYVPRAMMLAPRTTQEQAGWSCYVETR